MKFLILVLLFSAPSYASEVLEKTSTRVIVREHPKTAKPYVVIVPEGSLNQDPLRKLKSEKISRPDYRLLDPNKKSGEIPYEGPSSDRKKVYLLAGTLAAGGVAGAALLPMAPAAAAGTGSGAGVGAFAAGGAAIGTGTVSASLLASRPDPDKDRVTRIAKSKDVS